VQRIDWCDFTRRLSAVYTGPHRSIRTKKKLEYVLTLAGELGAETTADLTTEFAAKFVAERAAKVSLNTVRGELRYLKAAANYAVEEDWLLRGPKWRRVWPRKGPRVRRTLFAIEEVAEVLELLRSRADDWDWHRLYALSATVAYTAIRKQEALHLKVEDVKLPERVIEIVSRPENRLKTVESEAPVPIPEELAKILAGWLPRARSEWLFPGVRGRGPWTGGMNGERPTERLRKAAEEVGVYGLTLLALRHTFATWARRRWGLDARQLMHVLRHTTERTQENYVQPEYSDLVASVAKVSYRT
jgi:integrase